MKLGDKLRSKAEVTTANKNQPDLDILKYAHLQNNVNTFQSDIGGTSKEAVIEEIGEHLHAPLIIDAAASQEDQRHMNSRRELRHVAETVTADEEDEGEGEGVGDVTIAEIGFQIKDQNEEAKEHLIFRLFGSLNLTLNLNLAMM